MKKVTLIILITMVQISNLTAQEVFNRMQAGEQRIYGTFEMDPVFNALLGYARSFEIEAINRDLTIAANITLPIFLLDMKHYNVELASRITFFNSANWNVVNRLSFINKGNSNPVYDGNMLSIKEGLLFGYFNSKWYLAGELGYEKFLIVKLEHTDWYRDKVHDTVVDGWYSSTGGNISAGLQGGYTIANKIEITLRAGIYKTEGFRNPSGAPYYGSFGLAYHL